MSDQVPPEDGVEPGNSGGNPPVPPPPPQWNADELNDVGDLHGYLPYDPPPLGARLQGLTHPQLPRHQRPPHGALLACSHHLSGAVRRRRSRR